MPPLSVDVFQWLVNQGIGVLVAVVLLVYFGGLLDKLRLSVEANTLATNNLAALVDSHMPPGRRPQPPPGQHESV